MVKSRLIDISEDLQEHEIRLEFVPERKGWQEYEARVRLVDDGDSETEAPPGAQGPEALISAWVSSTIRSTLMLNPCSQANSLAVFESRR